MRQIRSSVFETNSSSTHSVALRGGKNYCYVPTYTLRVSLGEYGWEQARYSGIEEKLSYIYTMMQYYMGYEEKWDWGERDFGLLENSKWSKWIKEMVLEHCGQEILLTSNNDGYYPLGYIDHQSTDTLCDFWSEDEDEFKANMKDLIFNERYIIITDNDNH